MGERVFQPRALDETERHQLAAHLGDTPETVISVHLLRRGLCHAVAIGSPERPVAAIIQANALPTEPTGYGDDPAQLWTVLQTLSGWTCVNVPSDAAPMLAQFIQASTGRQCRPHQDVYYALNCPAEPVDMSNVRRLTRQDHNLMTESARELGITDWGFGSAELLLAEGHAAGAIVDKRLVSVAFTGARGQRYADIGVVTLEAWRGRGYSTAAASLVCAAIQSDGQAPVWSTGIDNLASRRVAEKLGFEEVSHRTYVIAE